MLNVRGCNCIQVRIKSPGLKEILVLLFLVLLHTLKNIVLLFLWCSTALLNVAKNNMFHLVYYKCAEFSWVVFWHNEAWNSCLFCSQCLTVFLQLFWILSWMTNRRPMSLRIPRSVGNSLGLNCPGVVCWELGVSAFIADLWLWLTIIKLLGRLSRSFSLERTRQLMALQILKIDTITLDEIVWQESPMER